MQSLLPRVSIPIKEEEQSGLVESKSIKDFVNGSQSLLKKKSSPDMSVEDWKEQHGIVSIPIKEEEQSGHTRHPMQRAIQRMSQSLLKKKSSPDF